MIIRHISILLILLVTGWTKVQCQTFPITNLAQAVELTMRYDTTTNLYTVYGKPNFTSAVGYTLAGGSQVGIVTPDSVSPDPFTVFSVAGGGNGWSDDAQVQNVIQGKVYHLIVNPGSNGIVNWIANLEKPLFRIEMPQGCSPGFRLWINTSDPPETNSAQTLGGNFMNFIGPSFDAGRQYYLQNYNSAGYDINGGYNCLYPSNALGVAFTSLNANAKPNCEVALNWTMNATTSIKHFEVMSSLDNNTFTQIAEVQANGASAGTFSALDTRSIKGNIYYRIDVVYVDGHKENSFTKAVRTSCDIEHSASLYPNPASAEVKFDVYVANAATKDNIIIEVFDATSKLVMQSEAKMVNGLASASLNVKHLANGTYMVKYYNTNRQYQGIVKFVKSID
jgi:Secretion system C-terminal sorting domain